MPINTEALHSDRPGDIARAAALLKEGKLVAIPTETVYGLAANGLSVDAVEGIFAAKRRPADNPLILHVASIEAAIPLWDATTKQLEIAAALSAAFWPGPLSIVLKAASRYRILSPPVSIRWQSEPLLARQFSPFCSSASSRLRHLQPICQADRAPPLPVM